MKFQKNVIPIILVLVVAATLRFLNFSDQPFTHDEFSTLFRLNHDNFNDLIKFGVYEDGHPAGFHIYSYYYTKLFGASEKAMKFPIILLGVLAVFMVYKIGKEWFNSTAGLYAASFMAFLQYAVAQSQIARMYGFGISFVLIFVFLLHQITTKGINLKRGLLYVLIGTICAYNHYFSLLFIAISWVTGIFLINKTDLKKYLLTGLGIIFSFLPFVGIFLHQLSKGGIPDWLGSFEWKYFAFYMSYIFHHSWIILALLLLPIVLFINWKQTFKYRWVSLVWFLLPMLIGFTYAFFRSNVIHERVLYFSFPFILLFLASFIKQVNFNKELYLVCVLLMVGSLSLVMERNHHKLFNNNRYKLVAESMINWKNDLAVDGILSIKATDKQIDDYYNKKHGVSDENTYYIDSFKNINSFIQLLEQSKSEYLFFGRADVIDRTYMQVARHYYPEIVKMQFTYAGEVFLLKRSENSEDPYCVYNKLVNEFKPTDTLNNEIVGFKTNQEYFGNIKAYVDTLIFSESNLVEISISLMQLDSIGGAKIVSQIECNNKTIDWRSVEIDDFIIGDSSLNTAMFTIPFPEIRLKKKSWVKFYIWNPNKSNYLVKEIKLITKAGNPYVYSGTEKIPNRLKRFCLPIDN